MVRLVLWNSCVYCLVCYSDRKVTGLVAQSCLSLCDPMDCSLPGCCVHGNFQAGMLEWVAVPFSRGSSWPRDGTWVCCIAGRFLTIWATREAEYCVKSQWNEHLRNELMWARWGSGSLVEASKGEGRGCALTAIRQEQLHLWNEEWPGWLEHSESQGTGCWTGLGGAGLWGPGRSLGSGLWLLQFARMW